MTLKLNGTNSEAAPAYAGDDADTGLQCGTNELKLVTGGTARATVDSSGNLGVGTAAPDALCHINKASGSTLYRASVAGNSTVGLEIVKTGSTTQSWRIVDGQTVNGRLEFYDVTDSATRMCIDGAGNVGIAHSSPQSLLTVGGDAITTAKPTVCVFPSSGNSSLTLRGGASTLSFDITGAGSNGTIIYDNNSDLLFKNGTLDSSTERMRMLAAGGLTFNGDTAAVNALDDYEEGTWTPTLSWGGTSATLSASTYGYYTKIGNTVLIQFRIVQTARNTPSGNALMGGLPFAEGAATFNHGMLQADAGINMPSGAGSIMLFINNTTSRWLYQTNTGHADLVSSQCADGTTFYGFATYRT